MDKIDFPVSERSGSVRVAVVAGLLSTAVLALLAFIIVVTSRSGASPHPWNPEMERNPFLVPRKIAGPASFSPGRMIRETMVNVSDADQQVDLGRVVVAIPAGTLSGPARVSVSDAPTEIPPPFGKVADSLAFIDIRIGEMNRFSKPLILRFPLKGVEVDPDRSPEQQFAAAFFDEKGISWKRVPFIFDAASKSLLVETDHLTVYWIGSLFTHERKHCTVNFLPSEIREVNRSYMEQFGITLQERLPLTIIRDMGFFVDTAYENFNRPDDSLPVPGYNIDVLAFLGSNASWFEKKTGKSETYTANWPGVINVNCDAIKGSADMMEVLRSDCAHELFHLVQREYYGISAMDLYNFRKSYFWVDAAAEYAGSTLAFRSMPERHGRPLGAAKANDVGVDFLKESLVSNAAPHRYQAAHFIAYLMRRYKLKAKALLDIPQLKGDFTASFNEYMAKVDPEARLARIYDDFSCFFVFDPASPCLIGSAGIYADVKKTFSGELLRFKDAAMGVTRPVLEMDRTLSVVDRYTSDLAAFRPDLPCEVTLSVGEDDRYVSVGVFPKDSGRPKKIETAFKDSPVTLGVSPGETLVLLFTPLSAPASVPVHIKAQRPAENLPAGLESGPAETAVFTIKVLDAGTGNALEAMATVTPKGGGPERTKNGSRVVFAGLAKGGYTVAVTAKGYKTRLGEFFIDPGKSMENRSECRLEKEAAPASPPADSSGRQSATMDSQSFDRMLQQRYVELNDLDKEVRQIWNDKQNCCSNPSHYGMAPQGWAALPTLEGFGITVLGCRSCGFTFSARGTKRSNGETYFEHYRNRVAYFDKLLQQAPPGFWEKHEYEDRGLNIVRKK